MRVRPSAQRLCSKLLVPRALGKGKEWEAEVEAGWSEAGQGRRTCPGQRPPHPLCTQSTVQSRRPALQIHPRLSEPWAWAGPCAQWCLRPRAGGLLFLLLLRTQHPHPPGNPWKRPRLKCYMLRLATEMPILC